MCDAILVTFLPSQFATGSDTKAIIPVVAGCVMLITAGINEVYTRRSQVIPPRLFKVSSFIDTLLLIRRSRPGLLGLS